MSPVDVSTTVTRCCFSILPVARTAVAAVFLTAINTAASYTAFDQQMDGVEDNKERKPDGTETNDAEDGTTRVSFVVFCHPDSDITVVRQ